MPHQENYIARAREVLLEREELNEASGKLFYAAIDLLKERGKTHRKLKVFKFQRVDHIANSTEPPIHITIDAGANLDKANIVQIRIQGLGRLEVTRDRVGREERFKSFSWSMNLYGLDAVTGCLAVVSQVATEVRDH